MTLLLVWVFFVREGHCNRARRRNPENICSADALNAQECPRVSVSLRCLASMIKDFLCLNTTTFRTYGRHTILDYIHQVVWSVYSKYMRGESNLCYRLKMSGMTVLYNRSSLIFSRIFPKTERGPANGTKFAGIRLRFKDKFSIFPGRRKVSEVEVRIQN